ncbi:hypothetical protein CYYG_00008 [Cyanophage SS120-1]|uniref:Uncharacterized protein n=1 Tax=Cyanophage SS120-1 TaxID=616674 RepID=M1T342_9CAUD|nr:hypothetical protein CYYG_00008 [Cyanophage SS120-1]AGG54510.1 hypothetical protein CYYG_00008 [Cyanophage SS120-1]
MGGFFNGRKGLLNLAFSVAILGLRASMRGLEHVEMSPTHNQMNYDPYKNQARTIEDLAEESRKAISKGGYSTKPCIKLQMLLDRFRLSRLERQ